MVGREDPRPAEDPGGHLHDPEQPGGGGPRRNAGGRHHRADRARDRDGVAPALTAAALSGTIHADHLGGERMKVRTIDQLDLPGKPTLIRVALNVPLDKAGNITDDTRIKAILPTIRLSMEKGAKTILLSHLGRPKGKVVPELSLSPVAKRLASLLGKEVPFVPDRVAGAAQKAAASAKNAA